MSDTSCFMPWFSSEPRLATNHRSPPDVTPLKGCTKELKGPFSYCSIGIFHRARRIIPHETSLGFWDPVGLEKKFFFPPPPAGGKEEVKGILVVGWSQSIVRREQHIKMAAVEPSGWLVVHRWMFLEEP